MSLNLSSVGNGITIPLTPSSWPIKIVGMDLSPRDDVEPKKLAICHGKTAFGMLPSTERNSQPDIFSETIRWRIKEEPGSSRRGNGNRSIIGGMVRSYGVPRNGDNACFISSMSSRERMSRGPASANAFFSSLSDIIFKDSDDSHIAASQNNSPIIPPITIHVQNNSQLNRRIGLPLRPSDREYSMRGGIDLVSWREIEYSPIRPTTMTPARITRPISAYDSRGSAIDFERGTSIGRAIRLRLWLSLYVKIGLGVALLTWIAWGVFCLGRYLGGSGVRVDIPAKARTHFRRGYRLSPV
jgi:hypothetical protein